jgi:hypothetical protein
VPPGQAFPSSISIENMAEIEEPSSSQSPADYEGTRKLEGEFKLKPREKVAFTVLMAMSFYASLESTAIGVALPVTIFPYELLFDHFDNC